jgi:hypothetical protein
MAMPVSSSSCARKVGVKSPFRVLWLMVRLVEKPKAPARTASATRARMAAMSPWFAGSSASARLPMV